MKIGVSLSPDMFAAIKTDAQLRGLSESHVVREILAKSYGVAASLPRRIYPREPRVRVSCPQNGGF
jgi:hypothetical protein